MTRVDSVAVRSGPRRALPPVRRRGFRTLLSGLVSVSLAAGLAAGLFGPTAAEAVTTSSIATAPGLPFARPTAIGASASGKMVFAHYLPSFKVSFDNKESASDYWTNGYLAPGGENGKHSAYGGFVRDRPLGRSPRSGDWKLADAQDEVRQAIAGGIDGFSLDLVSVPTSGSNAVWEHGITVLKAAASVDPRFKVMLMPDMSGSAGNLSAAALSDRVAELAAYPAAYHLDDGRLVVSPFLAEKKTVSWWTQFLSAMKSRHGISVAFVPLFLDEIKYVDSFAPISYGMSYWGARNPAWTTPTATYSTSPLSRAKAVVASGKLWMQPVAVQDERPRSGVFDEAENTTTLRNTWELARESGAQWVQLLTWNDYAEGTQFAPSAAHGWSYLDINAYYLSWFKTGVQPAITADGVYLTHRVQANAAKPTYNQSLLMKLRGGTPAVDQVEAIAFLTAPAKVTVTSGSRTTTCDAPGGVSTCTVPLGTGTVRASVTRGGSVTTSLTSPYAVVSRPYVQDLQYYAAGSVSAVGTTKPSATAPATTAPTVTPTTVAPAPTASTASPAPSVVSIHPTDDGYVNQANKTANRTGASSLSSRAGPEVTSYLRFVLPSPPQGKKLTSAVLSVCTTSLSSAGSSGRHDIILAADNWTSAGLTWLTRPSVGPTLLGTVPAGTKASSRYAIELDPQQIGARLGTSQTMAITTLSSDSLWLWSSDYGISAKRPTLVLTYS